MHSLSCSSYIHKIQLTTSPKEYVPEKPPLNPTELSARASLYFLLTDELLSYPSPAMPNTVNIGDIMARPAAPLADDLREFMESNHNGVILISFGSFVDHFPPDLICKVARSLSMLPSE